MQLCAAGTSVIIHRRRNRSHRIFCIPMQNILGYIASPRIFEAKWKWSRRNGSRRNRSRHKPTVAVHRNENICKHTLLDFCFCLWKRWTLKTLHKMASHLCLIEWNLNAVSSTDVKCSWNHKQATITFPTLLLDWHHWWYEEAIASICDIVARP